MVSSENNYENASGKISSVNWQTKMNEKNLGDIYIYIYIYIYISKLAF